MAFRCTTSQNIGIFALHPFGKIFLSHFISPSMISCDHDKLVGSGNFVPLTVDEGPSLSHLSICTSSEVQSIYPYEFGDTKTMHCLNCMTCQVGCSFITPVLKNPAEPNYLYFNVCFTKADLQKWNGISQA